MALKKEIIFTNGVKITYHMIDDIQVDNKNKIAKIKVASYTDETFRQKEIDNITNQNLYESYINQIMAENNIPLENRNIDLITDLSAKANALVGNFQDGLDLKVVNTNFDLKDVTDYNMSNLYELLKQEQLFIGSTDV